jgi:tetratricopeptide (TPR) repeat protein
MQTLSRSSSHRSHDSFRRWTWIGITLILALTALVYSGGLNGPFLFDDHVHITQNRWVKIDSLAMPDLQRAWNSSFIEFPSNRPLAQLSFGINHALAGLDPWVFKATNLVIHLLSGVFVFTFVRLACQATRRRRDDHLLGILVAIFATALWLLHPIHVSTVLYTVQRMAQLSTLSLLIALSLYLWGRLRVTEGQKGGMIAILATVPVAAIGFLGKENTVLLPLLLLACELTLLRRVGFGGHNGAKWTTWGLLITLPLVVGIAYLAMHPGMLSYEGRTFTFDERLLTQPRVLWLYIKLLFIPDISAFALFHDGLQVSTSVLRPPTTLAAITGLLLLVFFAWRLRARQPVFTFAVAFFLASHALESTVFPLEMVFEHRNYLAAIGPLFWLAHTVIVGSRHLRARRLILVLGALLLASYAAVAAIRVSYWSSYQDFVLSTAERHPDSPRANFLAGQYFISVLDKAETAAPELANAARSLFDAGLAADPRCINCLFGLLVLDLHLNRDPPPELIASLEQVLGDGHVGPTRVAVSHFSFLSRWHRSDGHKLSSSDFQRIFDAAQANPGWQHTARAGIASAYREYYEFVVGDLEAALQQSKIAVNAWPDQWGYHAHLVRILRKLGRNNEALAAAERAASVARNADQERETERMIRELREMPPVLP